MNIEGVWGLKMTQAPRPSANDQREIPQCPKNTKQQKIVPTRIETLLCSWPWSDNNLFQQ